MHPEEEYDQQIQYVELDDKEKVRLTSLSKKPNHERKFTGDRASVDTASLRKRSRQVYMEDVVEIHDEIDDIENLPPLRRDMEELRLDKRSKPQSSINKNIIKNLVTVFMGSNSACCSHEVLLVVLLAICTVIYSILTPIIAVVDSSSKYRA